MSAKTDIKILLANENSTLTEAVRALKDATGKNYNLKNFSAKIRIDSVRYSEFKQIAELYGYKIELVKANKRIRL